MEPESTGLSRSRSNSELGDLHPAYRIKTSEPGTWEIRSVSVGSADGVTRIAAEHGGFVGSPPTPRPNQHQTNQANTNTLRLRLSLSLSLRLRLTKLDYVKNLSLDSPEL
jgi:hypothetical protein